MKKLLILILFITFASCSEDTLKVQNCDCKVIKTEAVTVWVNGLPVTRIVRTERPYSSNDCDADGFQLSDNEIVKCK